VWQLARSALSGVPEFQSCKFQVEDKKILRLVVFNLELATFGT
jgi:hypothetical protein